MHWIFFISREALHKSVSCIDLAISHIRVAWFGQFCFTFVSEGLELLNPQAGNIICMTCAGIYPLAETWSKFWGDGVGALAPKKFFCRPPKMRNLEGTAGDSLLLRTKCWLSIIMYWRCIYYHILPFNAWFVPLFGWVRLNIEINHINVEPQVQIKAKSIIQFDDISAWILYWKWISSHLNLNFNVSIFIRTIFG